MNKILSALLVGFFAVSINAFAETPAPAAAPATEAAAPAKAEVKHTAAPETKKADKKHSKKAEKPVAGVAPTTK